MGCGLRLVHQVGEPRGSGCRSPGPGAETEPILTSVREVPQPPPTHAIGGDNHCQSAAIFQAGPLPGYHREFLKKIPLKEYFFEAILLLDMGC